MIRTLVLAAAIAAGLPGPAQARSLVEMRVPFLGYVERSDIEHIGRLASERPRSAAVAAVRAYGRAHCVELSVTGAILDIVDGDYVCVRRDSGPCLWTLRAAIRITVVDDGVF